MKGTESTGGEVRLERPVRRATTFEAFLEERGFQADACEATTHPDFYTLARQLWSGLNRIEEHWDGEDGEIDPVLMAHIAKDALLGI